MAVNIEYQGKSIDMSRYNNGRTARLTAAGVICPPCPLTNLPSFVVNLGRSWSVMYRLGRCPITVQTMTNTKTTDVAATVEQIQRIERVGADIVRVSVPTMEAAEAFKLIKQQTRIPIVADIHFDYRIALKVAEYGADCLRINPGNIGNEEGPRRSRLRPSLQHPDPHRRQRRLAGERHSGEVR